MLQEGKIELSVRDQIAHITFSHPKGNSMPGSHLRELASAIDKVGQDSSVNLIVLRSEGEKVFCSGASFDEMKAVKNETQAFEFFSGFARVILAMRRAPKFIISRVQGKVAGGGVGILAASDYALGSAEASVRLSELAIGIGPFIIGPAVLRKVGSAAFSEMAVSADWRDAAWAKSHGLLAEVHSSISELDTALDQLTKRLSGYNPAAMKELKRILWEGTQDWEELLPERAKITSGLVLSQHVQGVISKM